MGRARQLLRIVLALLPLGACSWIHPIVVINASDGPLDLVVASLATGHWLRGDTLYVASLDRFEAGKVGAEGWRAIPVVGDHHAPAQGDSAASEATVTLRIPPQTVLRIGSALNCRPTFDRCDRVGIVTLSLRGVRGSLMLEGAALRQAFRYERGTFALRYP